jgi:hypothetical protein
MHEQPENIRRRVVPRWRKLESTPREELTFSSQINTPTALKDEFDSLLLQWWHSQSVNDAAEVLYAATLGFEDPELYRAAQFIIESPSASPGVKKL